MQIQEHQVEIQQSSQDSWSPDETVYNDQNKNIPSLFKRITVKYDDKMIQHHIDQQCQKPILNKAIFTFENQLEETIDQNQTQQQQIGTNQKDNLKMRQQQEREQMTEQCKDKRQQLPNQNQQALFNAIQDDQNQKWVRKKRSTCNNSEKDVRPLTCPQCFTQICYKYQHQTSPNQSQLPSNPTHPSKHNYLTKHVTSILVQQHKIIRNRFATEKMKFQYKDKRDLSDRLVDLDTYQRELKDRYEEINVRMIVVCQQCQLELGYYDVNHQHYMLSNII